MRKRVHFILPPLLSVGVLQSPAAAAPVFIESGTEFGQGWIFRNGAQCWVATAKHVLPSDQGTIATEAGDFGQISNVRRHETLDIAIAVIEGQAAAKCPADTLGYRDSRPALSNASLRGRDLVQQKIFHCSADDRAAQTCGGISNTPVRIDTYGGNDVKFGFYSTGPQAMAGGDSGSVIRETQSGGVSAGQPVGMVLQANPTSSYAIVFSEVRAFIETLNAKGAEPRKSSTKATASTSLRFVEFGGALGSPDCGPLNALRPAPCPFNASPLTGQKTVDVILSTAFPQDISGFSFQFGASPPAGVEIMVSDADFSGIGTTPWTSVRYCRSGGQNRLRCPVNIAQPRYILLRFAGTLSLVAVSLEEK